MADITPSDFANMNDRAKVISKRSSAITYFQYAGITTMNYKGSCHCGQIVFEVEGELNQAADCNCSICTRMGSLHWFIPGENLRLLTPEKSLSTYTFGDHTIKHHFCSKCGIHPFGEGTDPSGNRKAAINVRCLEGVDLSTLTIKHIDGRSR